MRHLLREYIRNILLEAKAKDADAKLLSNQKIGFAAEHAVWVALGGADNMLIDGRISGPYSSASTKAKDIFLEIYEQMKVAAVPPKEIKAELGSCADTADTEIKPPPPPGAGNRPVDVESTTADIHVKYNDFKRLVGFQKETEDESDVDVPPALETGAVQTIDNKDFGRASSAYDTSLSQFFKELQDKANEVYQELDPTSRLYLTGKKKAALRGVHLSGPRLSGRKTAKSFGEDSPQYLEFIELRKAYQQALKIVGRNRFYEILDSNGFKEKLLQDIESLIFKSKNKTKPSSKSRGIAKKIYFAKFAGPDGSEGSLRKAVTCVYYDYSALLGIGTGRGMVKNIAQKMVVKEFGGRIDPLAVTAAAQKDAAKSNRKIEKAAAEAGEIPDVKGPTTIFYQVVDIDDESKVYFQIEFRLDGDSHPPQLKTGRAIMSVGKNH
jgi:hypothetical protein